MGCSLPGSSVHGNFPGKNSRVGCHALLQRIFLTQTLKLVSWIAGRFFTPEPSGKPRQWLKSRHHFFVQGLYGQSYGFSCSYVCMWELDYKEGWALKNWYFQTVMLEKTFESPLDNREIKPVNLKGSQLWTFIARTDGWSSNTLATWCKEPSYWKRSWCWERLRAGGEVSDRGWDYWMTLIQCTCVWANSRRYWRTGKPGIYNPWGHKELDMTEWLNNKTSYHFYNYFYNIPFPLSES